MVIKKIFNNNAVLVDDKGEESIVTGLGVGYNFKVGEEVDLSLVEKKYTLSNKEKERYQDMFTGENSYYEVASEIFMIAKEELKIDLYDQSILEMADHICFLIQRIKNNNYISFVINSDMMSIYPKEYEVSKIGCRIIENAYNVKLPEDETGFITFHIVSAEKDVGNNNPLMLMEFVSGILEIIKKNYPNINESKNGFTYSRMIIHLRFLANRIFAKERFVENDVSLFMKLYLADRKMQETIAEINSYISENYDWELSDEEKTYIMMHIKRFK